MTALISPSVMRGLRLIDESAMPSSLQVVRQPRVKGPTGATVSSGAAVPVGQPVSCRVLRDRSAMARIFGDALESTTAAAVAVPLSTVVLRHDVLRITTINDVGTTVEDFVVVGDPPLASSFSTSLLLQAKEA